MNRAFFKCLIYKIEVYLYSKDKIIQKYLVTNLMFVIFIYFESLKNYNG